MPKPDTTPAAGTGGAFLAPHLRLLVDAIRQDSRRHVDSYTSSWWMSASFSPDEWAAAVAALEKAEAAPHPGAPAPDAVAERAGRVAEIGWGEVDGERQFRAVVVFDGPPPELPIGVVWDRTPVVIALADPIASPAPAAGGGLPTVGGERIDLPGGLYVQRRIDGWRLYSDAAFDHLAMLTETDVDQYRVIARSKDPLDDLVSRFSTALLGKLRAAEAKYGHGDAWTRNDWHADLCRQLAEHVAKGDPLDVAAYAAFAWHHSWSTVDPLAQSITDRKDP